ncbi:MAG: aminopeptidase P family protein [Prevotella sp.]|nr:aminopeptidase P family protein [Prevotella sp.]
MAEDTLRRLRQEMSAEGIDAIIFPTADPHGSEYVAPHWQARRYVSGFTGSAGTAVVTRDEAALWTDSRYFLQAATELSGSEFMLMKEGLTDTPTMTEWLLRKMSANGGTCVAVDGNMMSYAELTRLQTSLKAIGVTVRTNYDAMRMIWPDRPAIPSNSIYAVDAEYIGESTSDKLLRIRTEMRLKQADAYIVTDLMEVAWCLNLRGNDIPMTPVFIGFLIIRQDTATLFCNGVLTTEAQDMLRASHVDVKPYNDITSQVKALDGRTLCNADTINYNIYKATPHPIDSPSPISTMKAIKNAKEIEGFRRSMLLDGAAMVKWLRWLKPAVEAGGQSEISVSDKLEQMRKEADEFRDLSFSTISGYNAHGAIVHYTATPDTNAALHPEGLLLVDSGAQYTCGTTDITRTIALGPVTPEMRRAYTLVLKANIALATTPFPEGTNGTQFDSVARSVLWCGGLHYMHGTGHGVGWRLCVHEGPHSIRMDWRPEPLCPGMTVTDEPGVYIEGQFGIRTENMMLVVESELGAPFLRLEPLTLCPIDTAPIDLSLMTKEETEWLNKYHTRVRTELLPLLTDEQDREWLTNATKPI